MGDFGRESSQLHCPLSRWNTILYRHSCLRWLTAKPPNLDEMLQAVEAIIRDGTRASSVLVRIRGLLRGGERFRERSDINDIVREVIALSDGERRRNGASLRTEMPENLPPVVVDRVLLQQVILNLMMNAVEAMRTVSDQMRILRIRSMRFTRRSSTTAQIESIKLRLPNSVHGTTC